jgi:hypothetical protein
MRLISGVKMFICCDGAYVGEPLEYFGAEVIGMALV